MRAKLLLTSLALSAAVTVQADYLFSSQFSSGRIPAVMSATAGENSPQVVKADYRQGVADDGKGWTAVMVSADKEYSAVCATHTQSESPMDATLSTPEINIQGTRPMLRWTAKSVYPSKLESYQVLVQEKDAAESEVLLDVQEAPFAWTDYAVDLSAYVGKTVTISFKCTSVNKFMLAVDDIYVGDPEDVRYACTVNAPTYAGSYNKAIKVTGSVANMGQPQQDARLVLRYGDEEQYAELPADWSCGENFDFEFDVPLTLHEYTAYTIGVETAAGDYTQVADKKVFCSYFPRTLMVEEFTGLWCNYCPKGLLELEKLEEQFGDNIIGLGVHMATSNNDVFALTDYVEANRVYAVPWLMLDRIKDSGSATPRYFSKYYETPTVALLEITDYAIEGDKVTVKTKTHWAEDLDNNDDRYRIGYTLTRNIQAAPDIKELYQKNSVSGVNYGRYNLLQQTINSDLAELYNVVISSEYAHTGLPTSLPVHMPAYQPVEGEFTVDKPALPEGVVWPSVADFKLEDCRIVAYVIDTTTGQLMNAVAQELDKPVAAQEPVTSIKTPCEDSVSADTGDVEYFNLQGIRISAPAEGIYIERRGSKVTKVMK